MKNAVAGSRCRRSSAQVTLAQLTGCMQPAAVARLPGAGLLASRISSHACASTSADALRTSPCRSPHSLAASLPARTAQAQPPTWRHPAVGCQHSFAWTSCRPLPAQQQTHATSAAGCAWRQLRQRQTACPAAVAAPEQQRVAEADSNAAATQPADTAVAQQQYVVINFYHLADIPCAQGVHLNAGSSAA